MKNKIIRFFLLFSRLKRESLPLIIALLLLPAFSEQIQFAADSMSGKTGKDADNTTLSGNAFVKTSSMEISADSIQLHGKDFRYITASGAVKGSNTESHLDFTCNRLSYDRETKIATLQERVSLTDAENDVKASAEIIEYNQNLEIAIMQINVNITQKNNVCSSAYAIYQKKAQMLNMSGNSKVVQDDDTFRAQEITLNLDTQEISLDGRVKGNVSTSGGGGDGKKKDESAEMREGDAAEIVEKNKSAEEIISDFNAEQNAKKDEDAASLENTEDSGKKTKKKKKKK